jgi:nucleoside-diphosphate kinase
MPKSIVDDFNRIVESLKHPTDLDTLSKVLGGLFRQPERTLTIIKPDAVQKGLIGEVIRRLEAEGVKAVGMKMVMINPLQAEILYGGLRRSLSPAVFKSVVEYMTSNRVVLIVWQGRGVVGKVRRICGPTDPKRAKKSQIRSLSSDDLHQRLKRGQAVRNIIHSSASRKDAALEISAFFFPWEILR